MDNIDDEISTASKFEELDNIFDKSSLDFDDEKDENRDIVKDFKTFVRFLRRRLKTAIRERMQKKFNNILYLTLDCPPFTPNSLRHDSPLEYIMQMQKQYPDYDIRVLMPIIGLSEEAKISKKLCITIKDKQYQLERTSLSFEFFLQNKKQEAIIYRFPKEFSHTQVYGIYCDAFSGVSNIQEISKLHYLAPFMKSARIAVRNFKKAGFSPEIVHVEHVPYYLGGEFELPLPQNVKILQIVKDFAQMEMVKPEIFWAAINLGDESALKKICRDDVIKKCIARLFNLQQTRRFTRMSECLQSIYENYYRFRKYVEQGEDLDENMLFNRMNMRISQLFPQFSEGELYYNQMFCTIKRADFWAVHSKTYYKDIFENPKITGKIHSVIEKTKEKSGYVSYGYDLSIYNRNDEVNVYQTFTPNNFRELRGKNKKNLLKEFSTDRIKTNFIDSTLFKDENKIIIGNLDSFYEAPLLFANPTPEVFANGVDILFNSILKLFDLHKNIQVVIAIKDGLQNNFIKNWVEFLSENKHLNGRWVFIDGEINLSKFLAASDMILLPRRVNIVNSDHFLAMHFGCVPVVSRSGVLNDTVIDIFDDITLGCGFKTKRSLLKEDDNPEIFVTPLLKALNIYQNNPSSWNLLIRNCMKHDSGWSFKDLEKYNKIYQELL